MLRRSEGDDISHIEILKASLSASVQNAAGPIGLALQHVILGKRKSSSALAAFGVCVSIFNLGTTVFQFLVDGSTSQVGSLVAKHLDETDEGKKKKLLGKHCKKSLVVSILAGASAGHSYSSLETVCLALWERQTGWISGEGITPGGASRCRLRRARTPR